MLYALQEDLKSIIAAADSLVEFEAAVTELCAVKPEGVESVELAGFMEMLTDFEGFKNAPLIVVHVDEAARDAFYEKHSVTVLKKFAMLSKQGEMMSEVEVDPYFDTNDTRTLAEIHGLDEEDRWDTRTPEEKERDKAYEEAYKKAKQAGELSGDSFGPSKKAKKEGESDLAVTQVNMSHDADGNIVIDDVKAFKGWGDDSEADDETAEVEVPQMSEAEIDALADDEDASIDPCGVIAIYHRVDVENVKLPEVRKVLEAAEIDLDMSIRRRNYSGGCWIACIRQLQAEQWAKVLNDAGFATEVYAVNDRGERILAKGLTGVSVVDTSEEAKEEPRPWNDRAGEYRKMKKAEKEELWKKVKPDEFIFCGAYEGAVKGSVLFITPLSYFKKHKKFWDKPLDIGHILPIDLKEVEPGVYRSHSRDWNHLSYAMNSKGFKESMLLQLYLNNENFA